MRTDDDPRLARNPLFAFLDRQSPLLTAEQEARLGRAAYRGCRKSRNQLVERNMRLVIDLAARSGHRDEQELLDRIQEGAIGLVRAAEKFDPARGCRFSTYATWWVRQAISRQRATNHPIHVPLNVLTDIRSAQTALADQLGREPTSEEVAAELQMSPHDVAAARAAQRVHSLDAPVGEADDASLAELLVDEMAADPVAAAEHRDLQEQVESHLDHVTAKERALVRLRYGLETGAPETLTTVCRILSLPLDEARRVEAAAMQSLRDHATTQSAPSSPCLAEQAPRLPRQLLDTVRARFLLDRVARPSDSDTVTATVLRAAPARH